MSVYEYKFSPPGADTDRILDLEQQGWTVRIAYYAHCSDCAVDVFGSQSDT